MENMDLDLSFLDSFVQQEQANGKASYDQSKSMSDANIAANVPMGLNFKAYE